VTRRRIRTIVAIVVIVVAGLYFTSSWQDMKTKDAIQQKVQQGLAIGMQVLIANGPRVHMVNQQSSYYVPNTSNMGNQTFTVYKDTLEYVNQDLTSPICKITGVNVSGIDDTVDAYATVRYRGFLGVMHTMYVHQEMKSPHFKNPTGYTHY